MKRTPHALAGCALLLLSACGAESEPSLLRTQRQPPAVTIVVLDPDGRLFDVGRRPDFFLCVDGEATTADVDEWSYGHPSIAYTLAHLPESGTELLVVASGCRPTRIQLVAGRNVVRLERGFRLRVTVGGRRLAIPEGAHLGLTLALTILEVDGIRLPDDIETFVLAADAFDADTPSHPQYVRIPADRTLDVFVPLPGAYELAWEVRAPGLATGRVENERVLLEPEQGAADLVFPGRFLETALKRVSK